MPADAPRWLLHAVRGGLVLLPAERPPLTSRPRWAPAPLPSAGRVTVAPPSAGKATSAGWSFVDRMSAAPVPVAGLVVVEVALGAAGFRVEGRTVNPRVFAGMIAAVGSRRPVLLLTIGAPAAGPALEVLTGAVCDALGETITIADGRVWCTVSGLVYTDSSFRRLYPRTGSASRRIEPLGTVLPLPVRGIGRPAPSGPAAVPSAAVPSAAVPSADGQMAVPAADRPGVQPVAAEWMRLLAPARSVPAPPEPVPVEEPVPASATARAVAAVPMRAATLAPSRIMPPVAAAPSPPPARFTARFAVPASSMMSVEIPAPGNSGANREPVPVEQVVPTAIASSTPTTLTGSISLSGPMLRPSPTAPAEEAAAVPAPVVAEPAASEAAAPETVVPESAAPESAPESATLEPAAVESAPGDAADDAAGSTAADPIATGPAAADGDADSALWLPQGDPDDDEALADDRLALRRTLGRRYDSHARVVTRILSERPGMRAVPGSTAEVSAGLVAVRAFLVDSRDDVNAVLRGARAHRDDDNVPLLARTALYGLLRLPAVFGPVFGTLPRAHRTAAEYQPGEELIEPAFLDVGLTPAAPGAADVEFAIWSVSAHRLSGIDPDDGWALFPPGSRFSVLAVDQPEKEGQPVRVLLRDLAVGPARRVPRGGAGQTPDGVLTRLREVTGSPRPKRPPHPRLVFPIGLDGRGRRYRRSGTDRASA